MWKQKIKFFSSLFVRTGRVKKSASSNEHPQPFEKEEVEVDKKN